MERQRGNEERDFASAVEQDAAVTDIAQERAYVQRGFYAKQLAQVFRYFSAKQVFVIRQDVLQADPKSLLDCLADFLCVTPFPNLESERIHHRDYPEPINASVDRKLRSIFNADITELETMLGWDLADWK